MARKTFNSRCTALAGALLLIAAATTASHAAASCPEDHYTALGPLYIDDEQSPSPYIYLESNGIGGLQRGQDGNVHGHCTHPSPDTWLF